MFKAYKNYIKRIIESDSPKDDLSLEYWRNRLFRHTIMVILPLSFLAYFPGVILSIKNEIYILAILDTLFFIPFLIVMLTKSLDIQFKKNFFIFDLYALSLTLLLIMGNFGPGMVYLLSVSLFAILILGKKAGWITLYMNVGVYFLTIFLAHIELFPYEIFGEYTASGWAAVGINLILFNTGLNYAVNELIDGLSEKIEKQRILKAELKNDKQNLEKALIKARESERLKTAFLENLSHEIRTPMNGIYGFASLLKKDLPDDKKEMYIHRIQTSSDLLLNIINDTVELSKLDTKGVPIYENEFSIREILDEVHSIFALRSKESINLNIEYRLESDQDLVKGDKEKLSQILNNLLSNSFKYTDKGEILLSVRYDRQKKVFLFRVRDTGIGILPENQARVFERFFQESDLSQGIGLGLPIVKSLVELMGGEIELSSEKAKGTLVSFFLPLKVV